jgi:MoxR-like ATPase
MAALRELFGKGADGLIPDLLKALPQPWDQDREADQDGAPLAEYVIDPPLAAAAWVALLLRQPLFLTGDPGVGKTRFADALAQRLRLGRAQRVQVKSDTKGRDLLYVFDEVARFRDATRAGARPGSANRSPMSRPDLEYVRLRGLGRAIMWAAGASAKVTLRPNIRSKDVMPTHLWNKSEVTLGDLFQGEFPETDSAPRHSVVLIDEIDKAPRDAPNDLLFEIESMSFEIEEIGVTVSAKPEYKPIVVITSNSERNLPDAFMRRCVFFNMTLPSLATLRKIAVGRVGGGLEPDSALVGDAAAFFDDIKKTMTEKTPGTAEFIGLVAYLREAGLKPQDNLDRKSELARNSLKVLAKTQADLAAAERELARSG